MEIGLKSSNCLFCPFFPSAARNTTSVSALTPINCCFATIVAHVCHIGVLYYYNEAQATMIIVWIIAFAVTITIHEAAHAWMADRLGDPTARALGRLTLNPISHYDPVGTTLLLALVVLRSIGVPVIPFGWAKPVPIDPYNLRNGRKDVAMVSLAGPFSNLVLATILSLVIRATQTELIFNLLFPVILLNISLAVFNLIPIHPLDGGKIIAGLMSESDASKFDLLMDRFGTFLLFMMIFPVFGGVSLIGQIIDPAIGLILHFLLPSASLI